MSLYSGMLVVSMRLVSISVVELMSTLSRFSEPRDSMRSNIAFKLGLMVKYIESRGVPVPVLGSGLGSFMGGSFTSGSFMGGSLVISFGIGGSVGMPPGGMTWIGPGLGGSVVDPFG